MKTTLTILALLTAGMNAEEIDWGKKLREGVDDYNRGVERIEREWQYRKEAEQRERIHREESRQREEIRRELERIRTEREDGKP
jgi:hypothetical protein